jgi:hypothetical protein
LRGSFNSLYSYIDNDSDKINIDKRLYLYFHGKSDSCRFITKSSIFHNQIVIAELYYKNNELWYKESKVFDKKVDYQNLDGIVMNKKFLILSNVKDLKFKYIFNNQKYDKLEKEIPKLIGINFKYNLKDYSYLFSIKSKNIENLKRLKFERKES